MHDGAGAVDTVHPASHAPGLTAWVIEGCRAERKLPFASAHKRCPSQAAHHMPCALEDPDALPGFAITFLAFAELHASAAFCWFLANAATSYNFGKLAKFIKARTR